MLWPLCLSKAVANYIKFRGPEVFATRNRALQHRYLVRLFVKELVLKNFAGTSADQPLERMIELSLYVATCTHRLGALGTSC